MAENRTALGRRAADIGQRAGELVGGSVRRNGRRRKSPEFAMIPDAAINDPNLSDRAFRVYAKLCAYRDNDPKSSEHGWAFPAQQTQAEDLGRSRRWVQDGLNELAAAGWVRARPRRELHPEFRGDSRALAYEVFWKPLPPEERQPAKKRRPRHETVALRDPSDARHPAHRPDSDARHRSKLAASMPRTNTPLNTPGPDRQKAPNTPHHEGGDSAQDAPSPHAAAAPDAELVLDKPPIWTSAREIDAKVEADRWESLGRPR